MKKYSILLMAIFATLFFASCEGPMGPPGLDGEDGINGENGEVACLVCHSGDNIAAIKAQFASSGHYAGVVSMERAEEGGWSASCGQCHSSEGFMSWAITGTSVAVAVPGKWECATCHGVHETFESTDYALRKEDPAAYIVDATASP
jgi:hypothetical protein